MTSRERTAAGIRGMITPVATPLTGGGDVDVPALRRLCELQVRSGIDAIFALGTTGEFYGLAPAQRRQVVAAVAEAAAGRVPVVAGIGGDSTAASLAALDEARHPGVSAYVVSTPYFLSYTQEELLDHFRILSDAAQGPIILYNYPGRYRHVIEPGTIARLLEEHRVTAVKDTQGDLAYLRRLLDLKRSFPEFRVFEGALPNLPASGRLGIDGSVQALGNLLPRECARLWRHIAARDWAALDAEAGRMWTFHQAIEGVAIFIAAMKGCLALRGWCGPATARPTRPAGAEQMTRLRALMDECGYADGERDGAAPPPPGE